MAWLAAGLRARELSPVEAPYRAPQCTPQPAKKHAAGPPGARSADRGAKPPGREPFSESPASRERRYGLPGPTVNRIPRTAVDNPGDNLGTDRRAIVDILDFPVDKPVDRVAAPTLTSDAKKSWGIAGNPAPERLWTSFRP